LRAVGAGLAGWHRCRFIRRQGLRAASARPILPANASSTSSAPSAGRRFLAFRIALARDGRSSSDRVLVSQTSCALTAAESSAGSFSRTGGMPEVLDWVRRACAGATLGLGVKPSSTARCPCGSLVTSGGASRSSSPASRSHRKRHGAVARLERFPLDMGHYMYPACRK
jgi:hypothetical protein